jgi:hypothetical protein
MDKTWTRTPPRGCVRPSVCPRLTMRRPLAIAGESGGAFPYLVNQMRERRLIKLVQHIFQFFVARPPRSKSGPIGLTQRGYQGIAVLLADFAILVSMTAIETGVLCHDDFLGAMGENTRMI